MLAGDGSGNLFEVIKNAAGQLEAVTGVPITGVIDAATGVIGVPAVGQDP